MNHQSIKSFFNLEFTTIESTFKGTNKIPMFTNNDLRSIVFQEQSYEVDVKIHTDDDSPKGRQELFEQFNKVVENFKNQPAQTTASNSATAAQCNVNHIASVKNHTTNTMTVSEAISKYIDEKVTARGWTTKTTVEYRANLSLIPFLLECDMPIHSITRDQITECIKNLKMLPININHSKRDFSRISVSDLIKYADKKNLIRFSERTVYKIIGRWSGFWEWLVHNIDGIHKNIVSGLTNKKSKVSKREEKRVFTPEELKDLFSSFDSQSFKHKNSKDKKLISLIALYSGMRENEICQLFTSDIIKDQNTNVWYFDINDNHPTKRLKNLNSKRKVPVHPTLIKAGLLIHLDKIKKTNGQDAHLWPWLTHSNHGGYSHYFSNPINKIIDQFVSIDKHLSFHSLRHNFIDNLKQNNASLDIVEEIVGHESGTSETRNRYGKEYDLKNKYDVIKKLTFDKILEHR